MEELIVGEEFTYVYLNELIKAVGYQITELGDEIIGEHFIVIKHTIKPEGIWSFILIDTQLAYKRYRLIYKHTE